MSSTPAVEADGLTKKFGDFAALSDLDLTVRQGVILLTTKWPWWSCAGAT